MKESFYVHRKLPDGSTVLVGQSIRIREKALGYFRYAPSYLKRDDAFALDPINLPLGDEIKRFPYDSESPGIPGVLLDGGPDGWGKKFLSWFKRPPPTTDVEFLLAGSGSGIGALRFTSTPKPPPPDAPFRPFSSIEDIIEAARDAEQDIPADPSRGDFFQRGSSVGGARPKTLIYYKGSEWIAKFPRKVEGFDNPLIEHLTMKMAKQAGIESAETELAPTAMGNVLLVKRFDLDKVGQSHFVSLNSLIGVSSIKNRREEDFCYQNIAHLANQLSLDNCAEEVYRRMVFNVAVGNTDDHMHNHALIKRPDSQHYELSPAYDLVPDPSLVGSHAIGVGPMGTTPNKFNILSAAKTMGVSTDRALEIIQQVHAVTQNWEALLAEGGATSTDIVRVSKSFAYGSRILESVIKDLAPNKQFDANPALNP